MTTINEWADFWFYKIGANVIPANTKEKKVFIKWTEWQANPIPEETYQQWKNSNVFENGIAIISGKLHRGDNAGKYLIFIDCDNQRAIDELCAAVKAPDLQTVSQKWIVEQHLDNQSKAHIYVISPFPFPKKSSDAADPRFGSAEIPAIEIKGDGKHGIAYCSPSLHKSGHRYQIIGTKHMELLSEEQAQTLLERLDELCKKYGIKYLEGGSVAQRQPATDLFSKEFRVYEGSNRHEALLRAMDALIARNRKIMDEDTIKLLAIKWNTDHCVPPLPISEFEKQWKCATKFMEKNAEPEPDPVGDVGVKRCVGKEDVGSIITIEGRIHSIDQIRQTTIVNKWDCLGCGREYDEKVDSCKSRNRDHPENRKVVRRLTNETLEDQRFVEVIMFTSEDHNEALDDDVRMWLNLTGDKVHLPLTLGADYRITGNVEVTENQGKSPIKGMPIFFLYLEVDDIIPIESKEEKVILTEEDRETFRKIATECPECIVPDLIDSFAPHIYGQDLVKEAILYQAVGANYEGNKTRTDIHVLLIGDPSEGKTEIGLAAARIAKGEYSSGEAVSRVGIGAGLVKDDNIGRWVVQGGIAVIGNKKLKVLDEIDKMPREYLNELLTVMDKGFYKLDKVKHAQFETKGAWLCTGNPKSGTYDTRKNLWQNIDFPVPVLTRFDLIFILKKSFDLEKTKKKLERINQQYQGQLSTKRDEEFITKWLMFAKEQKKITIEPVVFEKLSEFYHTLEKNGQGQDTIPITERQYHGMVRLAIARARLHLRDRVTEADAVRAIELMTSMMFMVGIDVNSGTLNLGGMTLEADKQKEQDKTLNGVLRNLTVGKTDAESVSEQDIVRKMMETGKWRDPDFCRKFLQEKHIEGKLWQPRQGYWCIA